MFSIAKKNIAKICNKILGRIHEKPLSKIFSIRNATSPKGDVLISYVLDPFLLKEDEKISNSHTNHWESIQIAKTFLELGYNVDIVDYRNYRFKPEKKYFLFLGARTNFQRIANHLNIDCMKIVHLDMAHWIFNNLSAYKRLENLQKRKGVTLSNRKFQVLYEPIRCYPSKESYVYIHHNFYFWATDKLRKLK